MTRGAGGRSLPAIARPARRLRQAPPEHRAGWVGPRWRKVLRDLGMYRTRTVLVVLSMAVGIFALGVTAGSRVVLARDLTAAFVAIRPASGTITTLEPFDDDLIQAVRRMPEVAEADGRRNVIVRVQVGPGQWRNLQLNAISDFQDIRIDKVTPRAGAWPPPEHQLVLERSGLGLSGAALGDELTIERSDGKLRRMPVAGLAHDLYALLYVLDGLPWGYVTFDTLEWLGEPRNYNELRFIVAEHPEDKAHVQEVARRVRDKVEKSGRSVYFMTVPDLGKHPLDATIQTILLLLGAMGVLALILSGLLVTNTIAALLAQELRMIGIMKAIGARARQIVGMYFGMVLLLGTLALLVAVPLSIAGTIALTRVVAGYLNFELTGWRMPASVLVLEVVVALVVPVLAAAVPVLKGARIPVRAALTAYGLGKGEFGRRTIDRLVERIRGLPRPLLLSLRNTFRRKARLALTLATLLSAGAIFVAIFSLRTSLLATMDRMLDIWQYDLWVMLAQPYRQDQLEQAARQVPGIVAAEGWGFDTARLLKGDGPTAASGQAGAGATATVPAQAESTYYGFILPVILFAPPADTTLLAPTVVEGRWLLPDDENAIVVNQQVFKDVPGAGVGDLLRLRIQGRDTSWRIVGLIQSAIPSPLAYVPYPYFARVTRDAGRATTLMAVTARHDRASQVATAADLERELKRRGLRVTAVYKTAEEKEEAARAFSAITVLLLLMAMLLALVGGLGLMGTMGLNVIERTREIGVMRAIGASDRAVWGIVLFEGVVIGLLSWLLALLVAPFLGRLLAYGVGMAFFQMPLHYAFAPNGALLWLAVVVVLSALASLLPARNATRVSVREVLAYE